MITATPLCHLPKSAICTWAESLKLQFALGRGGRGEGGKG